jgi:hypothetical protein
MAAGRPARIARERINRDDRPRDERPRDDRPRDDRPRDDRPRDDRPRDDRQRDRFDGRDRDNRGDGRGRDRWRERDDRNRDRDRNQGSQGGLERGQDRGERGGEDRRERFERRDDRAERDPLPVVEPQAQPITPLVAEERAPAQVLRDSDGGESHAPAFLQAPAAARPEAGEDEAPARRPRRRRAPRTFDGGDGAPPTGETEGA